MLPARDTRSKNVAQRRMNQIEELSTDYTEESV